MSDYYPDIESVISEAKMLRFPVPYLSKFIPDSDANKYTTLFRNWRSGGIFVIGEIVKYNGKLYRTFRNHNSRTSPPPEDIRMWYEVKSDAVLDEWSSIEIYKTGDLVTYENLIYVSLLDNNRGNRPRTAVETRYWAYTSRNYITDTLINYS